MFSTDLYCVQTLNFRGFKISTSDIYCEYFRLPGRVKHPYQTHIKPISFHVASHRLWVSLFVPGRAVRGDKHRVCWSASGASHCKAANGTGEACWACQKGDSMRGEMRTVDRQEDKMKKVDRQEDDIWILKTKVIPRLLDKSEIFGLRDEFLAALIQYVSACYNLIHLLYLRIHLDKLLNTLIHLSQMSLHSINM